MVRFVSPGNPRSDTKGTPVSEAAESGKDSRESPGARNPLQGLKGGKRAQGRIQPPDSPEGAVIRTVTEGGLLVTSMITV